METMYVLRNYLVKFSRAAYQTFTTDRVCDLFGVVFRAFFGIAFSFLLHASMNCLCPRSPPAST